ncbi:MAG: sugar-binding protein [Candidatus Lumbricidophila eiseniae]|uniref:Sugar-binding protein n=1 Tax=Candidatus Lumbricidiphila eiseniae TaxID=1969409 RepID=A0A2A6FP28_9MICO|nr:MAG: sugar-binding protein [Candidatus Lumbricidophila eiseniae]
MLPLILINLFVVAIPSIFTLFFSFTDWSGVGDANFIGIDNYTKLFTDPEFTNALVHNIYWTVFFLIVPMTMGLFSAYALTRIRRFRVIFRVLYFIPHIVASVVNAAIWRSIMDPTAGFGSLLHLNFLGNPDTALGSVAFINNWAWWGFLVVVFLAAMRSISPALYEAASLDGAGPARQFFSVTLPGIRPTFVFLGLMTIIWSFLSFDYVYILTQGGPAGSTDVLSTLLYRNAFTNQESGYASATGVVLALISAIAVVTYLVIRRVKKWEI